MQLMQLLLLTARTISYEKWDEGVPSNAANEVNVVNAAITPRLFPDDRKGIEKGDRIRS